MSALMIGILAASVIVLLFVLVKKRLSYFSDQGVPYVPPTLMDTLKSLLMSNFAEIPEKVYNMKRDSDLAFVGVYHTFLTPSVLILDPRMTESMFIKDFAHFQDHGLEMDSAEEPLSRHLFNLRGDEWRTARHKLLPTFTTAKLKGMVPLIEKCAHSLINEIEQENNQEIGLRDLFRRFSLPVIASSVFGVDPESVKDPNCEFNLVLNRFLKPSIMHYLNMFFLISFPSIAKFFNMKFIPKEVSDFFMRITKEAFETRKRSGVKMNDFVQLLLELKEKGSVHLDIKDLDDDEKEKVLENQSSLKVDSSNSMLEMNDEFLAAQAFIFIIGGYDNIAYLISLTLYLISKHNDIKQRVKEEIKLVKAKHGGMNYLALRDMKFLDACFNEALRMYPAAIFLGRLTNKNYTFSNGQVIKKGMQTLLPTRMIQNDSRYWSNPEIFNPERFFNESIVPGTYYPFGDGPRICIAKRLVMLTGKLMLAELFERFEILPGSKTQEPLKQIVDVTPGIEGGLWCSFNQLKQ